MPELVLEGTWEEVISHSSELAGKKVRLTVIDEPAEEELAAAVAAIREGVESFGEAKAAQQEKPWKNCVASSEHLSQRSFPIS